MLKNIRLHIEKDEEKQAELDNELATQILTTQKSNINAFQRNIPSLLPLIKNLNLSNYSVFINKFGEPNIVDYGLGRTFYGFHPREEVLQQLAQHQSHTPEILLTNDTTPISNELYKQPINSSLNALPSYRNQQAQKTLPTDIECLVVLGCGLGLHILPLLQQHRIKSLIVYEPEPQFFQCSMMITQWQDIFTQAKANDTSIFLQLEKDGRDIIDDINQLAEHYSISSFHLYKHYNHQVFESVFDNFCNRNWKNISQDGLSIKTVDTHLDYIPQWTPSIELSNYSMLSPPNESLSNNLAALKSFFPDIYEQYKDYKPQKWQPVINSTGEVNLLKINSLHAWYSEHPKRDCILNFESFNEQPNKDGLVLGYNGTKLAHYIHYQFVQETEELLKQSEEEVGALPDNVASIIMFGLGVGYQLEKLLDDHIVEKLFICEPNPDFFYASLFAIDWQTIFEAVEQSDSRIYLNIGDDGTNLFQDLLSQFHSIGPYILNSTYFYQSYYNASLNSAISQLREQLQVVISMGEYFDHAYYGIEHTKEGLRRQIPALLANPSSKLSYDDKEVPIFIVGNGPSLDNSIDAIKEWKEQAIIISCGTALQALHRHSITPDFHAEIEQNRATYDWAVLVDDLDYLRCITLISCNGIHPDTCDLYKDVLIAFKEGESSTVSALNILDQENYEVLQNAFPTVSNFACDLFSTLGFTSLYLLGVDLGFVNVAHHHSKSSGYYKEDGKETYNYSETANTSLVVSGNFRATVNTKHEFKVSMQVIEQVTLKKPKEQVFYNCSDGAKIERAMPTKPDDILIVATPSKKNHAIKQLTQIAFSTKKTENFIEKFESKYSHEFLIKELNAFEELIGNSSELPTGINYIIDKQKEMLFDSYKNGKSLLFYYLYGTVNYSNAVLTKLEGKEPEGLYKAKELWLKAIEKIRNAIYYKKNNNFDASNSNAFKRESLFLQKVTENKSLAIVSDSDSFEGLARHVLQNVYPWLQNVEFLTPNEYINLNTAPDYIIIYSKKVDTQIKGRINTVVITNDVSSQKPISNEACQLVIPKIDKRQIIYNAYTIISAAYRSCISNDGSSLILPKIAFCMESDIHNIDLEILFKNYYIVSFPYYVCIYPASHISNTSPVSLNGSRGRIIREKINTHHIQHNVINHDEFKEGFKLVSKLIRSSRKNLA